MTALELWGYLILAIVVFILLKLIVESIRFIFYVLLIMLVVVLLFGISVADIMGWVSDVLLWVL